MNESTQGKNTADENLNNGENINKSEINSIDDKNVKKNKNGTRRRIVAYIITAIICSTLVGVGSAIVTINTINNTKSTASTIATNSIQSLSIPEIAKKVSPSIVEISTKDYTLSNNLTGKSLEEDGVGTGIIFNKNGYILTNYHVIAGTQNVKVTLSNGKEVSAKVINYDSVSDLAVLKMADNIKVPGVAELGNSDNLQVGESVVAIGNPLGNEFLGTVTTGVVSALNRQLSIEDKDLRFIQTDAAINEGNSGGPLVNTKGQVIGINTAKIIAEGVEGMGFAIPINTVNSKIKALVKPMLSIGITCRDITQDISKENNVPKGVYILQVQKFSPAEKSGIKAADIITEFDGKRIYTVDEINKIKATHNAGDVVKIQLIRNGKTININLTLSSLS